MDVFARLLHNPHIGVQMRTVEMQPFAKQLYWEQKKRDQFYWISISANLSQKECVASSWLSSNCSSMRILLITGNHFPSTNPRVWPIHGPAALGRLLMLKTTIVLFNPWNLTPTVTLKTKFSRPLGQNPRMRGDKPSNREVDGILFSFGTVRVSDASFFFSSSWRLGIAAKRLGWTEQETESVQSWSRGQSSHSLEVDGFVCKDKNSCGDR